MEKSCAECPFPGCFFCVMKETNIAKRRTSVAKFFKELPSKNDEGQVLAISGLWNTAMAHPNDPEFLELGIFECMSLLICKGIENRDWLSQDQNIYIPYYAAHIIGSYTMNVEEFAQRAIQAGVIGPLVELLRGKLTWIEQRVAVRALGHLAVYDSTFPYVAEQHEILELSIQLATNSLDLVYTQFMQYVDRRVSYHCDLLTRGTGGLEMESRKAEEWASQLQCWSLQLINCFAFKAKYLPVICRADFLAKLPGMWGGLVNETSPAGVGLLRTICHHKSGRPPVAACPGMIEDLCCIARSSDDWQSMAVDILIWLLQDPDTRYKVLDKAAVALADLVELPTLGEHKRVGEYITSVLLLDYTPYPSPEISASLSKETMDLLDNLAVFRKKSKWEKSVPKEDLQIKQAAALVVKLEGNARFSSGDIVGAAQKYTEALALCPLRTKKERVVLHSNRAQCQLMLGNAEEALSDTTRALSIHNPVNRHGKSLWRRAQAYEILGMAKESLLDAIMFINENAQAPESDTDSRVPDYVESLVKKQMQGSWLFMDAVAEHGGIQCNKGSNCEEEDEDEVSEWETASEVDTDVDSDVDARIKEEVGRKSNSNGIKEQVARQHDNHEVAWQPNMAWQSNRNGGKEEVAWQLSSNGSKEVVARKPSSKEKVAWRPNRNVGKEQVAWRPTSNGGKEQAAWRPTSNGGEEVVAWRPTSNGGKEEVTWRPTSNGNKEEVVCRPSSNGSREEVACRPTSNGSREEVACRPTSNGSKEDVGWRPTSNGREEVTCRPTSNGREEVACRPTSNGSKEMAWKLTSNVIKEEVARTPNGSKEEVARTPNGSKEEVARKSNGSSKDEVIWKRGNDGSKEMVWKQNNSSGSKDEVVWNSGKEEKRPSRVRPHRGFKGVTVQDLLGPHYENSF